MATSARIRKSIDYGRLREAVKGDDIDTRTWCAMARVDDDPDAIRFESPFGWLVDVTIQGGPLDQEQITCRVSSSFAASNASRLEPISRNCEVLVLIPEGNANANPMIIGEAHNGGGCQVPTSVNGDSIDESKALSTHILVTPHAIDEQVAGNIRIKTDSTHKILGQLIELADENATQAYIRGTDFSTALTTLLSTWTAEVGSAVTLAQALAAAHKTSPPPGPYPDAGIENAANAWNTSLAALQSQITAFQTRLVPGDLLSTKINGD